jgi:hypothetical protein
MRTRFDQLGKLLLRHALAACGPIETDAEVLADPRRIDLYFVPDATREPIPDYLGLLGRITAGSSTLELFHNTPSGDELDACIIKHGQFRHSLALHKPPPPIPTQWIISSGRPDSGIAGLCMRRLKGWPTGIYASPPLLRTRLVVVSELPIVRGTLLLRLLGAGRVLTQAIAQLKALPADAPERLLALPILLRLRLEILDDPAARTPDDQEFLMHTQDIVENWRREAIQEGRQEGRQEGFRELLLRQLRLRFGHLVDAHAERRVATASAEQLDTWAARVLTAATLAELFAD